MDSDQRCRWWPLAIALSRRGVPDVPGTAHRPAPLLGQVDVLGGVLAVVGLGLLVGPLIEGGLARRRPRWPGCWRSAPWLVGFVLLERRRQAYLRPPPMLPLELFGVRAFTVANLVTFAVYAALSVGFFLLTVLLQVGLGYPAWQGRSRQSSVTVMLALFSLGRVASSPHRRPDPADRRLLGIALGLVLLARVACGLAYATSVPPALVVFGSVSSSWSRVTTTALADVDQQRGRLGVNNAVARVADLVAIAVIPWLGGLTGGAVRGEGLVERLRAGHARRSVLNASSARRWRGSGCRPPRATGHDRCGDHGVASSASCSAEAAAAHAAAQAASPTPRPGDRSARHDGGGVARRVACCGSGCRHCPYPPDEQARAGPAGSR